MKLISGHIKTLTALFWISIAVLTVLVDYLTGPVYSFPVLVAIPIALSSWYSGRLVGIAAGVIIMIGELYLFSIWHEIVSVMILILYVSVRLVIMFSFIVLIDIIRKQKKEIKVLKGFLPICSFCKKIRDDSGNWVEIEQYIDARSDAKFSHSLCPGCLQEHYGEFLKHGNK